MAPYEALYGRKCQMPTCWYKDGERMIVGPKMGHKIKEINLEIYWNIPNYCTNSPVAYRIVLPPLLSNIHDVFHVSQLKNYISDPSYVIEPDTIQLKDNLSFEVLHVRIEDKKIKRLRNKEVSLVKEIWNPTTGDATWELES
ncbi:uncharacterized protein [Cicer arietinum]|uniref:uncharacterized protein n=1 Tax=Cicer arietinum TaxID=3827 RepID=UPI003CC5A84A